MTGGDASESTSGMRWVPLESNPAVVTNFAHALGMPREWGFTDVWSPEPDALEFMPSPRLAVVFLYPFTPPILAADAARPTPPPTKDGPYFCKQTIGNACGTIALLHSVFANADGPLAPTPNSFFRTFLDKTAGMTPDERAAALETDGTLQVTHQEFAAQGQTEAPAAEDKVDLHFVAFVEHGGVMYEMDGRKDAPTPHGACAADQLLQQACRVIKHNYMAADVNEHRFTLLALTPSTDDN